MVGLRTSAEPGIDFDALPFGVVVLDREGTVKSYRPFEDALPGVAHDRMIGRNFFTDVVAFARVRRFQERFSGFAAVARTAVEPFEFVVPGASGERRVTLLFVRDEDALGRVSIIITNDGRLV